MEDNNINQWLAQARKAGLSDVQIKTQLKSSGWDDAQINTILDGQSSNLKPNPQTKSKPNRYGVEYFEYTEKAAQTPSSSTQAPSSSMSMSHKNSQSDNYTPVNYTVGSKIFSRSWATFIELWKPLISLSFIQIVLYVIIVFLFSSSTMLIFGYFGMVIASFIISITMTIIISNRDPSISSGLSLSGSIFFKYIGTSILSSLVIAGGYALFIIPGILMTLAFTTLPYIMVKENIFGLKALGRAYALARNFRGNIFGSMLILGLFNLLIFAGFFIIFIALFFVINLLGINLNNSIGFILSFVFPMFIFSLLPAFGLIYFSIIYNDLFKIRPPNTDQEIEGKGISRSKIYVIFGIIISILYIYMMFTSLNQFGTFNYNYFNSSSKIEYDVPFSDYPFTYTAPEGFEEKSGIVSGDEYSIYFNNFETNPRNNLRENINISIDVNSDKKVTVDDMLSENVNLYEIIYSDWTVMNESEKTIDSTSAKYIEGNYTGYSDDRSYVQIIVYKKNDQTVTVTFSSLNNLKRKYLPKFESSLSTLQLK